MEEIKEDWEKVKKRVKLGGHVSFMTAFSCR